jgi:DNA polymerase III epsilon subunit-like protein
MRERWALYRLPMGSPQFATRLHGLTDDDVVGSPDIADIADDIITWIEDTPIVGHNVKIEVDILSRSVPDWKPSSAKRCTGYLSFKTSIL